ncbi:hypothetical protein M9H77_06146 [Catharanthus roseus]|uniref:Uncharacterized protein n=1 Tax=Catharanthus roseus TaxID=4058 RepID=A0ACC0BR83_CATRO|nr:hypothetical protein M9H77_06146 [Catharanthus roseus]
MFRTVAIVSREIVISTPLTNELMEVQGSASLASYIGIEFSHQTGIKNATKIDDKGPIKCTKLSENLKLMVQLWGQSVLYCKRIVFMGGIPSEVETHKATPNNTQKGFSKKHAILQGKIKRTAVLATDE